MLSPRLSECVQCSDISSLLSDIDIKLAELSKVLYNDVIFSLNLPIPGQVMTDLLNYKRILTYKLCNDEYAQRFTVNMIASKVKLLKHK
jgi:hypothetical protein